MLDGNMISWIKLVVLISSVCGILTFYQTEENNNITIKWDSQTKTDLSLTNLICVFQSNKVLYEMINGVEISESQHQQFSGRVQLDRDALREGRIRLHLSRVTAEDSGDYRCDLAANYDKNKRRWELEAYEHFVINVTQTSGGQDKTSGRKAGAGAKHPPGCPNQGKGSYSISSSVGPFLAAVALAILIVYAVYVVILERSLATFVRRHVQHEAQN